MSLARSKMPEIKPWHEEFTLSDSSPNGVRLLVNGAPSVAAGCPKEPTWPHNASMAQHCIWPRHFVVSVIVGYEHADLGEGTNWEMQLETVSAWVIREILLEHAEREQQIELLEQHLEQLEVA